MPNEASDNSNQLSGPEALRLSAVVGVGAALTGTARTSDETKAAAHQQEPGNCFSPRPAVVNTQYGKVRD